VPGNEATTGHLTGEFHRMVTGARVSVTCATYNFSPSSNMWKALRTASDQPGVPVVVYVDAEKGDPSGVKAKLPKATVYRSAQLPDGKPIVSHTKFIIIGHQIVLLTSANFSYNAENSNVEMRSCTVELATPGGSSVMTTLRPSTVRVPRTVNDPRPVVT